MHSFITLASTWIQVLSDTIEIIHIIQRTISYWQSQKEERSQHVHLRGNRCDWLVFDRNVSMIALAESNYQSCQCRLLWKASRAFSENAIMIITCISHRLYDDASCVKHIFDPNLMLVKMRANAYFALWLIRLCIDHFHHGCLCVTYVCDRKWSINVLWRYNAGIDHVGHSFPSDVFENALIALLAWDNTRGVERAYVCVRSR